MKVGDERITSKTYIDKDGVERPAHTITVAEYFSRLQANPDYRNYEVSRQKYDDYLAQRKNDGSKKELKKDVSFAKSYAKSCLKSSHNAWEASLNYLDGKAPNTNAGTAALRLIKISVAAHLIVEEAKLKLKENT
jgi:hypothetical protein